MRRFWMLVYNVILVPLMWVGFYLMSLRVDKIRQGVRGRKNLLARLGQKLDGTGKRSPRFWIHNSSMGEFEQAKPLIRQLRSVYPGSMILVTFFSPSGLEHVRETGGADFITYIPFDSWLMARRFVRMVRPDAAVVIRHEFWPNHLDRLRREGIPSLLVNASIRRAGNFRIPGVLAAQRFLFGFFDAILAVSEETVNRLSEYRLYPGLAELAGDTRYEQVVFRAHEAESVVSPLKRYKNNRQCVVAGSTWPSDEAVLFPVFATLKADGLLPWIVLAPHEPTEAHLSQVELALRSLEISTCRFSDIEKNRSGSCDVLLIDRIGILASLYALGDIAYVGGGFGAGVHQVLEPAALGRIVFFGPRNMNSYEAGRLQKRGLGFMIDNSDTLYRKLHDFLVNPSDMELLGGKAAELVRENVGASERIVRCIEQHVSK
ncbi:hypothetical protein JW948_01840 [bacterium]|nr:hypothetical protein [bacterium]